MQTSERLAATIQMLHKRFGDRAVMRLGDYQAAQALSSGFPALDQLLGCGGIPRGRVMALCGLPSAGRGMLTQHLIAHAQRELDVMAYLDLSGTFDGESAARCAIDLERLLVIRPDKTGDSLAYGELVGTLVALKVDLIVVDASVTAKGVAFPDWLAAEIAHGRSAVLVLQPFGQAPLTDHAAVRLRVERMAWLRGGSVRSGAITGCRVRVTVLDSRFSAPGQQTLLDLVLEDP